MFELHAMADTAPPILSFHGVSLPDSSWQYTTIWDESRLSSGQLDHLLIICCVPLYTRG